MEIERKLWTNRTAVILILSLALLGIALRPANAQSSDEAEQSNGPIFLPVIANSSTNIAATPEQSEDDDAQVAAAQSGGETQPPNGSIFLPIAANNSANNAAAPAENTDDTVQAAAFSDSGQWSGVIPVPFVPVAAANLPDGKILFWSARDRLAFGGDRGRTYTGVFDPIARTATERLVSNTNHDMFCPGTTNLPDGRILVSGGSSSNDTSIYNPANGSWLAAADLNIPRGYHAQTMLANGDVFTIGGSWSGGRGNKHAELWTGNSWSRLSGIPVDPILEGITDPQGIYREDNHAWLWTAPNGDIFHAGPSTQMHWFDTNGNGSHSRAGARGNDQQSMKGTTVMFDVGKILKVGGALDYGRDGAANGNTFVININSSSARVTRQGNLNSTRTMHNSVVLPTGEVIVIGGIDRGNPFSDQNSRLRPEIWNPATGSWRNLARMATPRNYHSVALLLPDGRVLAGGGGLCGNCATNHPNFEIYSPPYLFSGNALATRPVIQSAPSSANNGDTINVRTNSRVSSFALVRLSSVTHSTNNDQRRIPLSGARTSGNNYRIALPTNSNDLLPGYYMLFAMNSAGTPSISKTIRIGNAGRNIKLPLEQVDALDYNRAVGVTREDKIYYYENGEWRQISGKLKHVSYGIDGSMWGVSANNQIYRRRTTSGGWERISGALVQVDALDYNRAVGVNAAGDIYYRGGNRWRQISGKLKHVSYGTDGAMWGVNANNQIYRRRTTSGGWQRVSGALVQVDARNYTSAVGVNAAGNIYYRYNNRWQQVSGALKHASYGDDGSSWGANSGDRVYRRRWFRNGSWQAMTKP